MEELPVRSTFAHGAWEEWRLSDGGLHRVEGPAVSGPHDGRPLYQRWYRRNALHRVGGPAVIRPAQTDDGEGLDEFWLWGHQVDLVLHQRAAQLSPPALEIADALEGSWAGTLLELIEAAAALAEDPPPANRP